MQFGAHIKALREARGLSLRALADLSDIDAAYLSRIENGKADPPGEEVMGRIAGALGEDLDVLLGYAGRVSKEVQGIIAEHPREFIELIRQFKGKPARIIKEATRAVRDGKW